jgi:hypothetical protein
MSFLSNADIESSLDLVTRSREPKVNQTGDTMKPIPHNQPTKNGGAHGLPALLCGAILMIFAAGAGAQTMFNPPLGWNYNSNGTLNLSWSGPGTLQAAPTLAGPWTAVQNNVTYAGSATQTVTGGMGFFRVLNGNRTSNVLPAPTIPPLPPIASATIQRLAAPTTNGDTILEVVFQQPVGAAPLSLSNFFTIDDQVYMLRDDGVYPDAVANDGTYTAIIPLDTNDLVAWNNHVDAVQAIDSSPQPVFTSRAITGSNVLTKFDLSAFLTLTKITLLPFPCSLGASDFYDWRKTILINDVSVVGDPARTFDICGGAGTPMGPWTFGFLMSNMCNQAATGINPVDFTRAWLMNWESDQIVNFDDVPNRSNAIVTQVINSWIAASGGGTNLNLAIAPFRLLAIVNRLDLRSHTFPYDNAGECRFVFGALDSSSPCSTLPFTVIFEYGVPISGCTGIKGWANQWAALNTMPFGPAYNAALEAITDQVTLANSNPSKLPNMSAINQIRSNDKLIGDWDLREFVLASTGYLVENTVKNSPAGILNNTPLVTTYGNDPAHFPNILLDNDVVPLFYMGGPFLGAHAVATPGLTWDGFPPGSIVDPNVRIHLSLNTCNGCHAGETLTGFTHVDPRVPGVASVLSGFLTGITVPDPKLTGITNRYSDLARRVADLDMVVHKPCVCLSLLRPITMPH